MPSKSNIILIGFMGSGKTTIGKELAQKTNFTFIDSDGEIEKIEEMSIAQIFKEKGEEYFRQLEYNFLKEFSAEKTILATGGGMPIPNSNMDLLKKNGTVIYLHIPLEVALNRFKDNDFRPLANKENLQNLYAEREITYKQADLSFNSNQEVSKVVSNILLERKGFKK